MMQTIRRFQKIRKNGHDRLQARSQKRNAGFTLVEVMLSIAILALISVPLMKYFTDSLRFSAQSAEKQGATLLAQETLEYVKSQKRIVVWQAAQDENNLPKMHFDITEELKNKFGVDPDMKFNEVEDGQPSFAFGSGSGTLQYTYTDANASGGRNYDVKVTLDTKVDAAAVDKPLLYGIDDASNVIASEYEEEQDAILYFLALNRTCYNLGHASDDVYDYIGGDDEEGGGGGDDVVIGGGGGGGGADDPGSTPGEMYKDLELLTEAEVMANINRTIHVEMKETKQDILGSNFITVTVYYVYTCTGVTGDDPEEYRTDDLISTNVEFLEGVYLMFSKMNSDKDKVLIEWVLDDEDPIMVPSQASYPVFWLVCQNLESINPEGVPLATDADKLKVEYKGITNWPSTGKNYIYTNVESSKVTITSDGSCATEVKGLTNSSSPVRLFDVTVQVFPEGKSDDESKELVKMITTFVE